MYSIIGSTHASLSFFLETHHLFVSGIVAPQAGLGQVTVRTHSQAITVASTPLYSLGSVTFG